MARRASRRRGDGIKSLVGFTVGEATYAVGIAQVREIVAPGVVVPMPHAPPVVIGVAEYRGEVLPIIDLRKRFALPSVEESRRRKWIVVRVGDRSAGLVVDAVTDVLATTAEDARDAPQLGVGDAARGIVGVLSIDGKLVFILDVARVAAAAEAIEVPQFTGAQFTGHTSG